MAIETNHLTKNFGSKTGCADICLSVPRGHVFGFLGPNGAGKSTLVKMLVGLLTPTAGRARLLGRPLGDRAARRRTGFLPELFRYPDWMTGREVLDFYAGLYHLDAVTRRRRIPLVLETVGLTGREKQRVRSFSKGMQQRLGLACALLPDPDLIFLDEPTSALDPLGRREVREIISALKSGGKTVFLNSHLLGEVEQVCDRVAVIRKGRIVADGALEELLSVNLEVSLEVEGWTPELEAALAHLSTGFTRVERRARLTLAGREDLARVAELVLAHGARLYSLVPGQRSLEELFVDLIGNEN
ncbi:multidrug ABC transporter ATP-binding protein [Desulfotomaculum copahuensis]|uniref:Multidrug ABC transporter ATP-binding protein n=1 Tax=Desulfotomaculum copahuensis TaxID=1838280 RepID=A0A1B7LBV8_9FIRM|nr:multidrug ABC transporter ATP-binding protein [Desulfotomaculum copahuensis]